MQETLIITILGPDETGLVKSISQKLEEFQGNWTESRMIHLAGQFAGLIQVSISSDKVKALTKSLQNLQSNSFKISIERGKKHRNNTPIHIMDIELLGQDRAGIVQDITKQLDTLNVNIEEFESEIKEASMAGGMLFSAKLKLGLPENVSEESVQKSLESMSDQFMVDINFS